MDGPTGPLTPWEATETQAKKTTSINSMLEAASPAMLYGYNAIGSAGLSWAYFGGNLLVNGSLVAITDGSVMLTASSINYVEADPNSGAVTVNEVGFDVGKTALYKVTTSTTGPISWQDYRQGGSGSGSVSAPNAQTGAAYTLELTDAPGGVTMNNAAANTVTIPPNSTVDFPVGTVIPVCQIGAGQTTIVAGTGVTVVNASSLACRVQNSVIGLWQIAVNSWVVFGDVQ
jgi:hypothetical protein